MTSNPLRCLTLVIFWRARRIQKRKNMSYPVVLHRSFQSWRTSLRNMDLKLQCLNCEFYQRQDYFKTQMDTILANLT
jgi:hypothetical protein